MTLTLQNKDMIEVTQAIKMAIRLAKVMGTENDVRILDRALDIMELTPMNSPYASKAEANAAYLADFAADCVLNGSD